MLRDGKLPLNEGDFIRDAMPRPLPHKRDYCKHLFSLLWLFAHSKRKEVLFLSNRIRNISLAGLFVALSIVFARFFAGDILIGGYFRAQDKLWSRAHLFKRNAVRTGLRSHNRHPGGCPGLSGKTAGPLFSGFYLKRCLNGLNPSPPGQILQGKGILDPAVLNSCTYRNYNIGSADSLMAQHDDG